MLRAGQSGRPLHGVLFGREHGGGAQGLGGARGPAGKAGRGWLGVVGKGRVAPGSGPGAGLVEEGLRVADTREGQERLPGRGRPSTRNPPGRRAWAAHGKRTPRTGRSRLPRGRRASGRSAGAPRVTGCMGAARRAAPTALAEAAHGRRMEVRGPGGIHEEEVQVPLHAEVLEPVVEKEHGKSRPDEGRRLLAPLAHGHGNAWQAPGQEERLVPDLAGERRDARGGPRGLAAVASQKDGGPFAHLLEQAREAMVTGVFPVPPKVRLPTDTVGRSRSTGGRTRRNHQAPWPRRQEHRPSGQRG